MPETSSLPVIVGVDVGPVHSAAAVLDEHAIWHLGPLTLNDDHTLACAQFRAQLLRLVRRFQSGRMVVEGFEWHGKVTHVEPRLHELIGVARSLSSVVLVDVVWPNVWQEAIVGHRASGMNHGWSTGSWKREVRQAVLLQLKARGIPRGEEWIGDDPGNHKADAVGIALYGADCARLSKLHCAISS